jgi:hypothetical protein
MVWVGLAGREEAHSSEITTTLRLVTLQTPPRGHVPTSTSTTTITMDAIREAINNVSLYEVKAAVRKAQNGFYPPSPGLARAWTDLLQS